MEIKKNILAIFRVLEAAPAMLSKDKDKYEEHVRRFNKILTDEDREIISKLLKAMMLLTAGNQEALRDPEKYDPAEAKNNLSTLFSTKSYNLYMDLGLKFELLTPPTKEDYEMAKKLLPIMGSSFVTPKDIDAVIGQTGGLGTRFKSEGYDTVYRGLHKLEPDTIAFLMDKPTWDIGRGVSTSYDEWESKRFSKSFTTSWGSTMGPAVLFTIDNVSKRGFHAGSFSRYDREKEIILAGQLKINSWVIEAVGTVFPYYDGPKECKIQITSEKKELIVSWGQKHKGEFVDMKFPTQDGESFEDFSKSLIGYLGGSIMHNDEELEIELNRFSILLKANATLP